MKTTANHPDWALKHKRPGTELKLINGRYYLYGVKSVYDKTAKRSRKVSLGILGSISQERGFIPSEKAAVRDTENHPTEQETDAHPQVFYKRCHRTSEVHQANQICSGGVRNL